MQKNTQDRTGIVFIHGAGLEGRVWSQVAQGLDHPCLLVEFPLREGSVESRSGLRLADYVIHAKRQVEEWGVRRFVLAAHSIGGVVALGLASGLADRLKGFAAIGAAVPGNGGSFLSTVPFPKRILLSAILRKWGTKPPDSAIRSGLCSDLTAEQAAGIVNGFIPEATRLYTDPVGASVPDVPRLYVKLTRDKEFAPSLQNKMIARLSPQSVQILETGHLPMLADPEGLQLILQDFLHSLDARG